MIDEAVISKIISTGDIKTPLRLRITSKHFSNLMCRMVYDNIIKHTQAQETAGNVPTIDWVNTNYPGFPIEDVQQDLGALCVELTQAFVRRELTAICSKLIDKVQTEADPLESVYCLRDQIIDLEGYTHTSDEMGFTQAIEYLKDWYKLVKEKKGIIGIPYPWKHLTETTGGLCPEHLTLFYGRPKQMKTWIGLNICVEAYAKYAKRVLIFAWEQGPEELHRRAAALICKLDYATWTKGGLTTAEEENVWTKLEELKLVEELCKGRADAPMLLIKSSTDPRYGSGINAVTSSIDEIKPDLVLVDGLYNMADDQERKKSMKWTNQGSLIDQLKAAARMYKVPIIATTQANRSGEDHTKRGTSDVAFTDGAGRWADVLIKVIKKKTEDETNVILDVRAAREFDLEGIKIKACPAHDFSEIGPMTEASILRELNPSIEGMTLSDPLDNERKKPRKNTTLNKAVIQMPEDWNGH